MTLQERKTSDFFNTEYVNWASYDNLRKIASLVDGQKNAARKILWYVQEKNIKSEIKVSQLDSKVAESEEYLHGSMVGVITNLAQNYTGTNNINMLNPEGNFGTRLVPEPSAARYIYTHGTSEFFEMFTKEDNEILEHQTFEGKNIEPKFMLPKLPLLLINGSEGISSGFAQKILPRNPEDIKKYLLYYLSKPDAPKKPFQNKPWYKGFKGTIEQGDDKNQWIISGVFTRKANKVLITELPIGYSLKQYKKVLDKLEDDKKITGYDDFSQDDFKFELKFNRKYLDSLNDNKLFDLLKLRKKVSENYTVMNHKNQVKIFDTINDILWAYFDIKIEYTNKRKHYLISKLTEDIRYLVSRYVFIQKIVDETLIITKRPDADILRDLDNEPKIIKKNDSYDYLLAQPINAMTQSKMEKLLSQIKDKKEDLDKIKKLTPNQIWINNIKGI